MSRTERVCHAPVDLRRGSETAESECHRAATVESGDGRFDRADSGPEDRAKERRCVKSREFRSAQLAHRARADLDRRDLAGGGAKPCALATAPRSIPHLRSTLVSTLPT